MLKKKYLFLWTIFIALCSHINFINADIKKKKPLPIIRYSTLTNATATKKPIFTSNYIPIKTILVVDLNKGEVLNSYNPTTKIYPASLTKLMTLYLTFEAIKNKKLDLNQKIPISYYAASVEPCKMGLKAGDFITVKHAIASLIVKSHNDNAVALAEKIAGSESNFANLMNRTARILKMHNTEFKNASGLPNSQQLSTPYDLVKLIMAIKRDYPSMYHLLSQTSFEFRGKKYDTHNRVLKSYEFAKVGKTGFTNRSGFNLITHANYNNKDIVAVVTGFSTSRERDKTMVALLDQYLGVTTNHSAFIGTYNKNNILKIAVNKSKLRKKPMKRKIRI